MAIDHGLSAPHRPARWNGWEGSRGWDAGWVRLIADLARADAEPLVGGQFFEAHGTAGANFVGADADFGAHTEFATIGESGGGIPVNGGGIDFSEEQVCGVGVAGDDAIGVGGAVVIDMGDGRVDVRNDLEIQYEVVVLGEIVLIIGGAKDWGCDSGWGWM